MKTIKDQIKTTENQKIAIKTHRGDDHFKNEDIDEDIDKDVDEDENRVQLRLNKNQLLEL